MVSLRSAARIAVCLGIVACGQDAGVSLDAVAQDAGPDAALARTRSNQAAADESGREPAAGQPGSRDDEAETASAGSAADSPDVAVGGASGSAQPPARSPEPNGAQDAGDADPIEPPAPAAESFSWRLPEGFPVPIIPADNPMSEAKVQLGRRLFYDKRLSGNETQSCASCHQQALAFTDRRATGLGSTGEHHTRGPQPLVNLAYASSLTWANPLFAIGVLPEPLERQSQIPLYGDSPVELGMVSQSSLVMRLQAVDLYREMFARAFPAQDDPVSALNVGRALAAFERTIVSGDSPYDRYVHGDASALTESAQRGLALFESAALECSSCHTGFNFTEHVQWEGRPLAEPPYRNTGLYNIDGAGAYPEPNTGTFNVTMNPDDMGKFRVPTLRNVAVTAPYMHDGSIATLSEVIDHYAAGGRTIAEGPNAGVGGENPLKDPRIHGFEITEAERRDLIAFLESLTDQALLTNPAFADPWLVE